MTCPSLRSLFNQVLEALDRNDPAGAEPLLAQPQGLMGAVPLEAIRACLSDFDFRGAEVLTKALRYGRTAALED